MNKARQKHKHSAINDEDSKQRKKHRGPELLEFESTDVKTYVYNALPPERKRIRLLRLFAGVLENPQINCEMFEAEFDGHGILRHVGNDGPTSGRVKGILSHASIVDTLKTRLPKLSPEEAGDASQEKVVEETVQGVTPNSQPPGGAGPLPTNGAEGSSHLNDEAQRILDKINEIVEGIKLISFPVVGDVLDDTIMPPFGFDDVQLDDVLDRAKLRKALENTTIKDIVDMTKLRRVLSRVEREKNPDPKFVAVLNGVKLDEVLKSSRLGKKEPYHALSWRWGDEDDGKYAIMIKRKGNLFKKRVSRTLGLALKFLRLKEDRVLWIDAICIDQKNLEERSFQVSLMSLVYTGAKEICVWLGEDDDDSTQAIQFVKDEISQLKDFDKLCIDQQHSPKWKALLGLMQRDWFSRRWVVQEIALAEKAQVYCGPDQIPWVDLAIAVELFVEVETATHRLSELIKKDDAHNVVPYWFEHVSELGASVLVNATARIFRGHKGGGYGPYIGGSDDDAAAGGSSPMDDSTRRRSSRKDQVRRSLLSLEYLVTSLSIFDCGRPHDSIYALIAIARDAAPHPPSSLTRRTKEALIAEVFSDAIEQKPYPLDYNSPYPDVCKEFLQFCIRGAAKTDKVQALDILCRPWAKDWRPKEYIATPEATSTKKVGESEENPPKLPPILKHEGGWMRGPKGARVEDNRDMTEYFSKATPLDSPMTTRGAKETNEGDIHIPASRRWFPKEEKTKDKKKEKREGGGRKDRRPRDFEPQHVDDLALPSWVATIAGAAFDIFPHPGMDMVKMGRKNADPLVGTPQDGRRNYNACQLWGVDVDDIKFRRRARLGHYSLYVKGFRFDQVEEVSHVSQAGTIPSAWLDLAKWSKARRTRGLWDDPGDPPDDFWRTLVADRGMHNQNPPYYYMRACKETVMKGGLRSNAVDTSSLIHNERNSIVAEFCRRVQSVIWNRALIRTKGGKLGLASDGVRKGDWVCLIYGCTVPVILRKHGGLKSQQEYDRERYEDCIEALRRCIRKAAKARFRKAQYRNLKKEKPGWEVDVQSKLADYKQKVKDKLHEEEERILTELNRNRTDKFVRTSTPRPVNADTIATEHLDTVHSSSPQPINGDTSTGADSPDNTVQPRPQPANDDTTTGAENPDNAVPASTSQTANEGRSTHDILFKEDDPVIVPTLDTELDEEISESESEGDSERKERQKKAFEMDPFRFYNFLGEAYIHGMMDGEAVREKFYKGKPDHIFELR
ncbi:hypothetical protein DPSP01_007595 [Paraphaeosphaeria sporulosa]